MATIRGVVVSKLTLQSMTECQGRADNAEWINVAGEKILKIEYAKATVFYNASKESWMVETVAEDGTILQHSLTGL